MDVLIAAAANAAPIAHNAPPAVNASHFEANTKTCTFPKCKQLVSDGDGFVTHVKQFHPDYNPQSSTLFNFKCFRCTKCKIIKGLSDRINGERIICVQCAASLQMEDALQDVNIPMPGPSYTESISISWTVTAGGKDVTQVFQLKFIA